MINGMFFRRTTRGKIMNIDEANGLKDYSPEKDKILQYSLRQGKYLMRIFNQPERTSEKDQLSGNSGQLICDVPNTPTKGSESSRND